jgi:hypothetical protein
MLEIKIKVGDTRNTYELISFLRVLRWHVLGEKVPRTKHEHTNYQNDLRHVMKTDSIRRL